MNDLLSSFVVGIIGGSFASVIMYYILRYTDDRHWTDEDMKSAFKAGRSIAINTTIDLDIWLKSMRKFKKRKGRWLID